MTGVTAVRDMNHIPELAGGCRGRVRRDTLRRGPPQMESPILRSSSTLGDNTWGHQDGL